MRATKPNIAPVGPGCDTVTPIGVDGRRFSATRPHGLAAQPASFQRERELRQIRLLAADDPIGRVAAMHFGTTDWALRYLSISPGKLFSLKHFLVPAAAIGELDARKRVLNIELTRRQVEDSPPVTPNRPVSRREEAECYEYYDWRPYWELASPAGFPMPAYSDCRRTSPAAPAPARASAATAVGLRRSAELRGAAVDLPDGTLGNVNDCLIDTRYWVIRYLEVDTGADMPGRMRLISPGWIESADWERKKLAVRLARSAVENAPAYDSATAIGRRYEGRLFRHYGQPAYWLTARD